MTVAGWASVSFEGPVIVAENCPAAVTAEKQINPIAKMQLISTFMEPPPAITSFAREARYSELIDFIEGH
jgi:hypothetical protein